jgi:hypothetical protein
MARRLILSAETFVESSAGNDAATAAFSQQNFNPLAFIYHSIVESGNVTSSEFTTNSNGSTYRVTFAKSYSVAPHVLIFNRSPRSPNGASLPISYIQGYGNGTYDNGASLFFSFNADTTGISMTFRGNGSSLTNTWPIGKALDTFWMTLQT